MQNLFVAILESYIVDQKKKIMSCTLYRILLILPSSLWKNSLSEVCKNLFRARSFPKAQQLADQPAAVLTK